MNILSIQSHVAYGHVGNSAAVFALQRLGVEVWPIHTVQFSNHTGYGVVQGRAFDAGLIRDVVQGIAERGALAALRCRAVGLSRFRRDRARRCSMRSARAQRANPTRVYCCDPVIGDVGRGVFVRPGVAEFMREQAVPAADIVTPNQFELDYLTGREHVDDCRTCWPRWRLRARRAANRAGDVDRRSTTRRPMRSSCSPAIDTGALSACARPSCRFR